jgi:hypothetical protein
LRSTVAEGDWGSWRRGRAATTRLMTIISFKMYKSIMATIERADLCRKMHPEEYYEPCWRPPWYMGGPLGGCWYPGGPLGGCWCLGGPLGGCWYPGGGPC